MSERYQVDGIAVIKTSDPGAGILECFQATRASTFVLWDPLYASRSGVALKRSQLVEDLLHLAFRAAADRIEWRLRLEAHPSMLGPLIAANILGSQIELNGSAKHAELSPDVQRKVEVYLSNYVAAHPRRKLLEARVVNVSQLGRLGSADMKSNLIAVQGDEVRGVLFSRAMWRDRDRRLRSEGRDDARRSASVESMRPFIAHPRLDVEGPAQPGQVLPFKVGFSDRPDPEADLSQRINIPKPMVGESIVVVASADGATIVEPSMVTLPLDYVAGHEFKAIVSEGVDQVQLRACYNYHGKPVGHIVKSVSVGYLARRSRRVGQKIKHVSAVGLPRPTTNHAEISGIDVILYVHKRSASQLTWQAYVPETSDVHGTYSVSVEDTAQFARQLTGLRSLGDESPSAREELFVTGQRIADLIPREIVEDVLAPALKQREAPAMLIYTDEPYIPWELARPDPKHLGCVAPSSLGALARIGRWWSAESLAGPRSSRPIQHMSAVAARQFAGNQTILKHAIDERTWLKAKFPDVTTEVEAVQPDIDMWLDQPRRAAHLGHIALHGYSDVPSDAQGLILADNSVLTPYRLAGQYYEGNTPRFEVMFLNACQVGTAGQRLGRMAGFPGSLLAGGASGFIGPLWQVEDAIALDFAKAFYQRVLKEHAEVGEALRQLRGAPPNDKSITPWAYLFYGHPRLQLVL